jgi:Protein of unknown function (DUF3489)
LAGLRGLELRNPCANHVFEIWQPHTVRGFLAVVVRKKLGRKLESEKTDGERVYRTIASKTSADSAAVPSG